MRLSAPEQLRPWVVAATNISSPDRRTSDERVAGVPGSRVRVPVQAVLGEVAGIALAIKLFWGRIADIFRRYKATGGENPSSACPRLGAERVGDTRHGPEHRPLSP